MTWTPLKGPWTPPPELTGMTIPEICEELLRLRAELKAKSVIRQETFPDPFASMFKECKCSGVLPIGQHCPHCGGLQP